MALAAVAFARLRSLRRAMRKLERERADLDDHARRLGEARFCDLANTLEKFVWVAGPNGQVFFYNDAYGEYAGTGPEVSFARLWRDIAHPDDQARCEEAWWNAISTGLPYESEVRLRCAATGEYRWFLSRALPVVGPHGEVIRWHGTSTDIHAQKLAAQQVETERRRLASLLAAAPAAVAMFRAGDGRCLLANRLFTKLVGGRDPAGRDLEEIFANPAFREVQVAVDEVLCEGRSVRRAELPVSLSSGPGEAPTRRYFQVTLEPVAAAAPGPSDVVLYLWDVTPRVEARIRQSFSEERFRRIFSSNFLGMFFWDLHGRVIDANDAFLSLTGHSRSELRSGALAAHQFTPPEYAEQEAACLDQLAGTDFCEPYEKEIFRRDGSRLPTLFGSAWIDRDRGEAVSFVLDLTRQKQAEAERTQLQAREESARAAARLKSRFLANASHELRTPLHAVLGFARLLRHGPLGEAQEHYAREIERSGEDLLKLINDVLDLSRIEAARIPLHPARVLLGRIIQDAITTVRVATSTSLPLHFASPEPDVAVAADPVRLTQLFTNVIGNAVKFTPRGEVRVELLVEPGEDERRRVTVRVRDTGIGISPGCLARLFEPFERGEDTRVLQVPGTGLGLSISRELARLMGGDLTLASEEGCGTVATITLSLPAMETVGCEPARPEEEGELRFEGARVLVAEDHPVNQAIAVGLLEGLGCRVSVAASGRETLRLAGEQPFDLLLLDCQLPDLNGFEVTRAIRRKEEGTPFRLPILALTADATPGTEMRCLAAGMDEYLTKPLDHALFANRLARYLTPAPPRCLHERALRNLLAADASGTLLRNVLEIFRRATPPRLAQAEAFAAEGSVPELLASLHALRSSLASVGLGRGAALCGELEEELRRGRVREPARELLSLRAELEKGLRELARWQASYAPMPSPELAPERADSRPTEN